MVRLTAVVLGTLLLAACGSAGRFSRQMEEPVALLQKASSLALDADADLTRAHALGIHADPGKTKPDRPLDPVSVCAPWAGPTATALNLIVFSDAVDTVAKVGDPPDDRSYSGYLRKFGANAKVAPSREEIQARATEAKNAAAQASDLCRRLLTSDLSTESSLAWPDEGRALPAFVGIVLAVDGLAKAMLSQAEAAQRELAVRQTLGNFIPQMEEALNELSQPAMNEYAPRVVYPQSAADANARNNTVLGATITIRRWLVAQELKAQWAALKVCRERLGNPCLGDPIALQTAQAFGTNVRLYRSLSKVDPQKISRAMNSSIEAAKEALKIGGLAGVIDAIVGLTEATKDLSDSYQSFEKSKK